MEAQEIKAPNQAALSSLYVHVLDNIEKERKIGQLAMEVQW